MTLRQDDDEHRESEFVSPEEAERFRAELAGSRRYPGVAHLAGPDITVEGRWLRQRCAWCGELLVDYDLSRVAVQVEPGKEPQPPGTWTPGAFVQVDGPMSTDLEWRSEKLPPNACMRMPAEETR